MVKMELLLYMKEPYDNSSVLIKDIHIGYGRDLF